MAVENTFDKRCLSIQPPPELSFTTASIAIVFALTNIPGNTLIVLAVAMNPNKNLRTPFNWLVANLAIADLIVGIIAEPVLSFYVMREGLGQSQPPEETKILHVTYFMSCTASILSLTSLAVERYLAVRKPNTYRANVTNKRILLTVVVIWLISFTLPYIYLHVGFPTYAFIFANASVAIAVPVICIAYTLIKRKVRPRTEILSISSPSREAIKVANEGKHLPDVTTVIPDNPNEINQSVQMLQTNQNAVPSPASSNIMSNSSHLEEKITKIFLIVLIALLCCHGPSTILMYFVNYCKVCSCTTLHVFRDTYVLFVLLNSSVNFFCYAFRSRRFRSAFVKLLRINRGS